MTYKTRQEVLRAAADFKFCKVCQCETIRNKNGKCKLCVKAYNAEYRKNNQEKLKSLCRAWRTKNKEHVKLYAKIKYENNKEEIKKRVSEYRKINKEKVNASNRDWKKKHADSVKAINHKRRSIKRNALGTHTAKDIKTLLSLQKGKCACCKVGIKNKYHIDHIIPLSGGGSNDKYNLQLLCPLCNYQKHTKHPIDFMQSKGYLL